MFPCPKDNLWVIVDRKLDARRIDLQHPWHRIGARAGLDEVGIRDLRHRLASRALALGESLSMIGKLPGHRDVQSTAQYAHLVRASVKAPGERVSGSLLRIRIRLRTVPCRMIRAGRRRNCARRARAHGQEEAMSEPSLVTGGSAGGGVVTCVAGEWTGESARWLPGSIAADFVQTKRMGRTRSRGGPAFASVRIRNQGGRRPWAKLSITRRSLTAG